MTIVAILDVVDQASLISGVIGHLRSIGVDRIIAIDTGSTDGSLEILSEEERVGDVWCLRLSAHIPERQVTEIRSALARESGATWVVQLRADELLIPATGTLRGHADLDQADVLGIFSYNVVVARDGLEFPWPRTVADYHQLLLYARPEASFVHLGFDPAQPEIERLLPSRLMARPVTMARPKAGADGHEDQPGRWRQLTSTGLLVARVPPSTLQRGTSEETLDDLRRRSIVRAAADVLEDPVGDLESSGRTEALARAQPWLSMAGRACAMDEIPIELPLEPTFPSSYPTIVAPPDHVIKLFPKEDAGVLDREAKALRIAARDGRLPVPRYRSSGSLDDDWRYLAMSRVPGSSMTFALDTLKASQVISIAAWVGTMTQRLHAIPLESADVADAGPTFADQVSKRHANARDRLADRGGLPDHLLAQVDAWLPSVDELLETSNDEVLVHGDLEDDHVMVTSLDMADDVRALAIIDFGEAVIGNPYYDLGPAWWTWLNIDRRYLDAFLAAARLPGWREPGFPRIAMAWTLIRCSWHPRTSPFVGLADDLDHLAALCFGAAA